MRIDWLAATLKPTDEAPCGVELVQTAASLALGCALDDWVELEYGAYGYQQAMVGPGGARLMWDAPGRQDAHLSLPGKACGVAGREGVRTLLRFVQLHGKPTRIDLAMDDFERVVSPDQVDAELRGPDAVTHAREALTIRGHAVRSEDLTGATIYLGSPSSRQRLRVYDKGLESHGAIDAVRWELQLRAEAAESLIPQLLASPDSFGQVFASRLVTFLDFRDRAAHSEVEKRPRLAWFERLVGLARKVAIYPAAVVRTVDHVAAWVDRQVAPSLAVLLTAWGGDIDRLVVMATVGRERWKPKHRAMLEACYP